MHLVGQQNSRTGSFWYCSFAVVMMAHSEVVRTILHQVRAKLIPFINQNVLGTLSLKFNPYLKTEHHSLHFMLLDTSQVSVVVFIL